MNIEPLIMELMNVNGIELMMPKDKSSKDELLKILMTISIPAKLSKTYYELEKLYIDEQKQYKDITRVEDISTELMKNVYIIKGDITTIKADAIVNAANEKLLGCFVPGHHCIDNAIHMASGMGLRYACHLIMEEQGHDEAVGLAKITKGFNLPSKYVVHTVGPNLNGPKNTNRDEVIEGLRKCYLSVLREINKQEDIRNIVFCSISTGIYGVPIELASEVALTTIKHYLENEKHHLEMVVINVFSEEDYDEYKNQAKKIK